MSDFQRFFILENVGKIKNVKNVKNVTRIKNVKNVFYIYAFKRRERYNLQQSRCCSKILSSERSFYMTGHWLVWILRWIFGHIISILLFHSGDFCNRHKEKMSQFCFNNLIVRIHHIHIGAFSSTTRDVGIRPKFHTHTHTHTTASVTEVSLLQVLMCGALCNHNVAGHEL